MIDEEGFAVITDFGIARAAQSDSLTRSGTTVGTPSYLSPEACSGEQVGPAADQYSLGIVGYEMVTGALPFAAESSLGMMYAQVHSPPRPSDQLRPDCPPDLRDAIMRMLEKSPPDRFPTLKEAVLTLSGSRSAHRGGAEREGDDSVRSHIGLLAVARPGRAGETRRTPMSPAPLSTIPPNTRMVARRRRVQVGQVLLGLFLAALGAGAVLVTLRDRLESAIIPLDSASTAAAAAADAKADSILLVTRGAAEYAREHAVAARVPAAGLASGDSLRAVAESLATAGAKSDAALLLQRAATFYSSAESSVQTSGPAGPAAQDSPAQALKPPPQRPVQPTGNPPSAAAAKPPVLTGSQPPSSGVSDTLAIGQFYAELERAVESRQLSEVQRLLPNMSDSETRDWRDFFVNEDIRSLDATYRVLDVTRQGEVVFARVQETVVVHWADGKSNRKRDNLLWTQLTYGPQGWREIRRGKAPK
jgi:hypothetical protein